MLNHPTCWLTPRAEARLKTHREYGVYARTGIARGELIAVWGGEVVPQATFNTLPDRLRRLSIQVEEGLFLVSLNEGPADYVNHSCDPNSGLSGQIALVAMCEIAPGEEISFDYAMSDVTDYDEFQCECGAPDCRGVVRGSDWRRPELWERYAGFFSPYVQRRIDRLRRGESVPD